MNIVKEGAGIWWMIHKPAALIVLDSKNKAKHIETTYNHITFVSNYLDCETCREHFSKTETENPFSIFISEKLVENREDLVPLYWTWMAHDKATEYHNKVSQVKTKRFSWEECKQIWLRPPDPCTECNVNKISPTNSNSNQVSKKDTDKYRNIPLKK